MSGTSGPNLYIFDANKSLTTMPLDELMLQIQAQGLDIRTEAGLAAFKQHLRPGALGLLRYLYDQGQYIAFSSSTMGDEHLESVLQLIFTQEECATIIDQSECTDLSELGRGKQYAIDMILNKPDFEQADHAIIIDPDLDPNGEYFSNLQKLTEGQQNARHYSIDSFSSAVSEPSDLDTPTSFISASTVLFRSWMNCIDFLKVEAEKGARALSVFSNQSAAKVTDFLNQKPGLLAAHINEQGCLVLSYYLAEHNQVFSQVFACYFEKNGKISLNEIPYSDNPEQQEQYLRDVIQDIRFCPLTPKMVEHDARIQSLKQHWKMNNVWTRDSRWLAHQDLYLFSQDLVTSLAAALEARSPSNNNVGVLEEDDDEEFELEWSDDESDDDTHQESASMVPFTGDLALFNQYGDTGRELDHTQTLCRTVVSDVRGGHRTLIPFKQPAEEQYYYNIDESSVNSEEEKAQKLEIIADLMNQVEWSKHAGLFGSEKDPQQSHQKVPKEVSQIKAILANTEESVQLRYARLDAAVSKIQNSVMGKLIRFMLNTPILKWFAPRSQITNQLLDLVNQMGQHSTDGLRELSKSITATMAAKTEKKDRAPIRVIRSGSERSAKFNGNVEAIDTPNHPSILAEKPLVKSSDADVLAQERERAVLALTRTDGNSPDTLSSLSLSERRQIVADQMHKIPEGGVVGTNTALINAVAEQAQAQRAATQTKKSKWALPFARARTASRVEDLTSEGVLVGAQS